MLSTSWDQYWLPDVLCKCFSHGEILPVRGFMKDEWIYVFNTFTLLILKDWLIEKRRWFFFCHILRVLALNYLHVFFNIYISSHTFIQAHTFTQTPKYTQIIWGYWSNIFSVWIIPTLGWRTISEIFRHPPAKKICNLQNR